MAHTVCMTDGTRFGEANPSCRLRRVLLLLASIAAILVFMFLLAPAGTQLPGFRPIVEFIDERGIEANAYYYTEVEEFSEAEINLNHTMNYMPGGRDNLD